MSLLAGVLALVPFALALLVAYIYDKRKNEAYGAAFHWQILPHFNILVVLFYDKFFKYFMKYGPRYYWDWKFKPFEKSGVLILYSPFNTSVQVADPDVISNITASREKFPKPIEDYAVLNFYGLNVVSTEHMDWKRHRKIVAPSFSEDNNRVVFDVTVEKTLEMLDAWGKHDVIPIDNDMVKLTLHVISGAGFGKRLKWDDDYIPEGHQMSYGDALEMVSAKTLIKLILPRFLYALPQFKPVDIAYREFDMYIKELVENAKKRIKHGDIGSDLLTQMVSMSEENDEAEGDFLLSNSELSGNIFVLLLAGHETTAHTLMYVLLLLAKYPAVQEKLFLHVQEVIGDHQPSYDDVSKLDYCSWVFMEGLRMFPPVTAIPKVAGEDVQIGELFIKEGTKVDINVPALHRNTKYWKDPDEFNPERFKQEKKDNLFIPFSAGVRSCLGKRFAHVEAVVVLAMIVQQYKLHFVNEEDKDNFFESNIILTLTPKHPLKLRAVKR